MLGFVEEEERGREVYLENGWEEFGRWVGTGEGDGEGEGDTPGEAPLTPPPPPVMVKFEDAGDPVPAMLVEELLLEKGDDTANDLLKGLVKDDDEEPIVELGLPVVEVLMGEELKAEVEVDVEREVEEEVGFAVWMGKGNSIGSCV